MFCKNGTDATTMALTYGARPYGSQRTIVLTKALITVRRLVHTAHPGTTPAGSRQSVVLHYNDIEASKPQ